MFRQQAAKGTAAVRPVAARISEGLEKGDDLDELLKTETAVFPPLFTALATVGEESGMLPEVFRELEKYYRLMQRLRQQFLAQIAWPAFQFVAAIFVIAGLIFILGIITESNPGSTGFDPIGIGTGPWPALRFLICVFTAIGLTLAFYVFSRRVLREGTLDAVLLRIPVLGPCAEALALTALLPGLAADPGDGHAHRPGAAAEFPRHRQFRLLGRRGHRPGFGQDRR